MIVERTYKIRGVAPFVMHNSRLANPLDPLKRELSKLTAQKKKTDSVHEQICLLEWEGGLYLTEDGKPCIRPENIERMVEQAAANARSITMNTIRAALYVIGDSVLECAKWKSVKGASADPYFRLVCMVGVQKKRVLRTRPIFREWSTTVRMNLDNEMVNIEQIDDLMRLAGQKIGLGEMRPRKGRFEVLECA